MRIVLKKSIALHPFYGTTDDVINVPDDVAEILFKDGAAEPLNARQERLEAAKLRALTESESPEAEVVEGEVDPALAGLDHLFEKQNAGVPVVPVEPVVPAEPDSEPKKPSRK